MKKIVCAKCGSKKFRINTDEGDLILTCNNCYQTSFIVGHRDMEFELLVEEEWFFIDEENIKYEDV